MKFSKTPIIKILKEDFRIKVISYTHKPAFIDAYEAYRKAFVILNIVIDIMLQNKKLYFFDCSMILNSSVKKIIGN